MQTQTQNSSLSTTSSSNKDSLTTRSSYSPLPPPTLTLSQASFGSSTYTAQGDDDEILQDDYEDDYGSIISDYDEAGDQDVMIDQEGVDKHALPEHHQASHVARTSSLGGPSMPLHLPLTSRVATAFLTDQDDDDGGEMLARLMKTNEGLRNGTTTPQEVDSKDDSQGGTGTKQDLTPQSIPGHEMEEPLRPKSHEERRQLAIKFLEDLVLGVLDQIRDSARAIRANRNALKEKKKKANSKKRKSTEAQDDGDGVQSEEKRARSSQSHANGQEAGLGIKMVTKNRKTGQDQVISWPEDPLSFKPEDKDTALNKMTRILRVASLMYEAVLSGTPTTKRDIFYNDVRLFEHQRVVDKIIDDLIASAGLKRADFNVCASAKGLVASRVLRIFLKTGEELSMSATLAALIPPSERIERIELAEPVSYILIVEKDAVFSTLCGVRLLEEEVIGNGILITGKGYPDLSTLQLLSRLAKDHPDIRIYALMDGDPHGIEILSTYTFGSQASKHSYDHHGLHLGQRLEWIGVKISELEEMGVGLDDLLPLSDKDWSRATAMIRNNPDMPDRWRRELCQMLHLNKKAEIEIIHSAREEKSQAGKGAGGGAGGGGGKLVNYIVKRLSQ